MNRLPLAALLALATTVFLGCLTEVLPASILLPAAADLRVSPAAAGQLVTGYAITTAVSAIPLTAATSGLPRRAPLLALITGFVVTNLAVAVSPWFALVLVARIVSGCVTGVMWSLVANYAMRMVPAERAGRALAVAMAGTPVGFALGVPAGAMLGALAGWRWAFAAMGLIALPLLGWVIAVVPRFPGESAARRTGPKSALRIPGLRPLLVVALAFSLGHNIFYTYLGPTFAAASHSDLLGLGLLVFGVATVLGLWLVGTTIDRHPVGVPCCCAGIVAGCFVAMAADGRNAGVLVAASGAWGVAFGGLPAAFQALTGRLAGRTADTAQALTIAAWNGAVAGGAGLGGVLLAHAPVTLPWTAAALVAVAGLVVIRVPVCRSVGRGRGAGAATARTGDGHEPVGGRSRSRP